MDYILEYDKTDPKSIDLQGYLLEKKITYQFLQESGKV